MRSVRLILELLLFLMAYYPMRLLSFKTASNFMGRIFSFVGSKLPVTKVAYKNLSFAFPNMSQREKDLIIKKMWENLGRIVGEFPKIQNMPVNNIKTHNSELLKTLQKKKIGVILLTAHFGNWEVALKELVDMGIDMAVVYRKINNPFIDRFILNSRNEMGVAQIPKSNAAVKQVVKSLDQGKMIGVLADQKQNTGIPSLFFSKEAMTGTLPAKLAIKKNTPLVFVMCVRTVADPTKYDLYIENFPQIKKEHTVEEVTQKMNDIYADWIRKYPEQWFWVHKRWPKELYKSN